VMDDLHFDESLHIKVELEDVPHIWGSADLLRRVFVNLINNAVKYNDKPEKVIQIGCRGVLEKVLAPYCEIYVKDNGIGIPESELDEVFAMFVRGSSADEQAKGSGIGLAVVKRIIELHYGEISVDSAQGEGSEFILTLPMQKVDLM